MCGRCVRHLLAGSDRLSRPMTTHCKVRERVSLVRPTSLSEDRVSNPLPPRRIDPPRVHGKTLQNDYWRHRIEIHLVYPLLYDPIAHHAEHDKKVQARVKNAVVEPEIESANGSVHQSATRDEDKASMVFRLGSPINGQGYARAEDEHVLERNRQERFDALLMEHGHIEAGHDDGSRDAQYHHDLRQPRSKPSEKPVHADFSDTHQSRL